MWDEIYQTFQGFFALFRRGPRLPYSIVLPLVVMAVAWPALRVVLPGEREAFMVAFVLAMGLRLVLRADGSIRTLQSHLSNRTTVILALLAGPGILALLIWKGEPLWCQRFLSLYFLGTACLYVLDVIDGRHAMVRHVLPASRPRGADALMTRVMAICYLALLLLNETMIREASLGLWLLYFGLLPMLLHRLVLAVMRTVDQAYAKGLGRF
jgi:hypothetical protein